MKPKQIKQILLSEIKKVSDILYKENYKINENGTQVINNSLQ